MINDNDIKRILEESDNTKVPEKISQGIDNTLNGIKCNKPKNKKTKKSKKMLIAASVAALVLIGTPYMSKPVEATINKVINKMEDFFGDTLFGSTVDGVNLNDYKTIIGTTVEDKGIKVTLNDFFMEDDRIYVNVALDSKDIDDYARDIGAEVFINGKKIELKSKRGYGPMNEEYKQTLKREKNKEKNLLLEYEIDSIDLDAVKDVKVNFKYVNAMKKEYFMKPYNMNIKAADMVRDISGKWNFAFSYDGKKMQDKIVTKLIGETIDLDGHFKVYIDKVKITPVSVTIKYKKYGENNTEGGGLELKVIDKNNNLENFYSCYLGDRDYYYQRNRIITEGMDKITIVPAIDNGYHGIKYFKDKALVVENK